MTCRINCLIPGFLAVVTSWNLLSLGSLYSTLFFYCLEMSGEVIKSAAFHSKEFVNGLARNKEPWQIVAITASGTLVGVWLFEFFFQGDGEEHL